MTDDQVRYSAVYELAPEVEAIVRGGTSHSQLAKDWLRFASALLDKDSSQIDLVVTPNARFHELEAMGIPAGPEGLKRAREAVNAAFRYERVKVVAMRFEGADIVEADLDVTTTHVGPFMGVAPTGRQYKSRIFTRNRFEGDRMAERWDRTEPSIDEMIRQLRESK